MRAGSARSILSGFTRLAGAKGDEEAAKLAVRLSDLVQESAASRHGRAVKSLGDGVMLHFRDSGEAVAAALDLVDATPMAGLPPARVGITSGPVVFRDGDYFGRAVNMASRITDYARPSEVLLSEAAAESGAPGGTPSKKSESQSSRAYPSRYGCSALFGRPSPKAVHRAQEELGRARSR